MQDVPRPYTLIVTNSFPEKQFIKLYGQELFDKLKGDAFRLDAGRCAACGHQPSNPNKLYLHIPTSAVNKKNPELTEGITLCKMCHMTQHIESAIKNKWVYLVNSIYDQNNINRLSRANQIYQNLNSRAIVKLKKTPEQFLKEIYSRDAKYTTTLKIIFNNNFNVDDL